MLSTYCQNCGAKNEYRFKKPNFCASCGEPLSSNQEQAIQNKVKSKLPARKIESSSDEEGTDIYEVPEISKLEYEIDIQPSSFSLGSLFQNVQAEQANPPAKRKRGRPRKNNGKTT